ncbi:MAG: DnaD domain protein [Clostridiales bacterium]|nr:DnaD domain protein [Clostridiales bacterium]
MFADYTGVAPPPATAKRIEVFLSQGFTEAEILYAFERADSAGAFAWDYIKKVLEYERKGIDPRKRKTGKNQGGVASYEQREAQEIDLIAVAKKITEEGKA